MQKVRQLVFFILLFPNLYFVSAMDKPSQDWIQDALSCSQDGAWVIQDKSGRVVVVRWEMISKCLQRCDVQMILHSNQIVVSCSYLEDLASLYADAMQESEMHLAESCLGVWVWDKIRMIYYWKSGYRDILYDSYIKQISRILTQKSTEPVYIFTVSEILATGDSLLLGSVMFGMKQDYAYGNVKMFDLVVRPDAQARGLDRILASAIFKLLPQAQCIFIEVNCSDEKAIRLYESMGFERQAEFWGHAIYAYVAGEEGLMEREKEVNGDFLLLQRDIAAMFQDIRN